MSSFLENENQMVVDAELQEIGEQLLEDWEIVQLEIEELNS